MATIRSVPHLESYIAEPVYATISTGHTMNDTATKIWNSATTQQDQYTITGTGQADGSFLPDFRYIDFLQFLLLNAQYNPQDNNLKTTGSDIYTWNPSVSADWVQSSIQGTISVANTSATSKAIHFVNGNANASGLVQSNWTVETNIPFVIPMYRYGIPDGADTTNFPPVFVVEFGTWWQIVLYASDQSPELRLQNSDGDWTTVSVGPGDMFNVNEVDYLTVQILDKYLVITNGLEITDTAWTYFFSDAPTTQDQYSDSFAEKIQKPIVTAEDNISVFVQNHAATFAFWYLDHTASGQILSPDIQTDQFFRLTPFTNDDVIADANFRIPYGSTGDITLALAAVGNSGFNYTATVTTDDTRYSPLLYEVEIQIGRYKAAINRSVIPVVASEQVETVSLNSTTQDISGSLTLNNYGGIFRNVTGVHGIALDFAWNYADENTLLPVPFARSYGNGLYRKFTGFFQKSDRQRSGPNDSHYTTELVSRKQIIVDTPAINVPIMDGVCEIYAYLNVLYRCGFNDDPSDPVEVYNPTTGTRSIVYTTPGILAAQDPWTGDYITLRQYWTNRSAGGYDPGASRACRQGLCDHTILPSQAWNSAPKLKWSMGTSLWQVLEDIRQFSFPFLFLNNWGNVIILHPFEQQLRSAMYYWFTDLQSGNLHTIGQFREVSRPTGFDFAGYNEFHSLSLSLDVQDIRNRCLCISVDENDLVPIIGVYADDLTLGDKPNYKPWFSTEIIESPFLATQGEVNRAAYQMWKRTTRARPKCNWTSWGQPAVYPYMLTEILEKTWENFTSAEVIPEAIKNTSTIWRIVGIQETMNAQQHSYTSSYEGEFLDPSQIDYYDLIF